MPESKPLKNATYAPIQCLCQDRLLSAELPQRDRGKPPEPVFPIRDLPFIMSSTSFLVFAMLYPGNVTGTVNATLVLLSIPFALAWPVIPAEYGILKDAYHSRIPNFPEEAIL